jgi:hypothetical protein
MKALGVSVLPSRQNLMLAIKNRRANKMKNREEKTSALADSVANLSISINRIPWL